jgi:hypothetical protein
MKCRNCGLENPPSAQRCDCGYDFIAKRVEESYLARDATERPHTKRSGLGPHVSPRVLVRVAGVIVVVALGAWRAHERQNATDAAGETLRQEAYKSYSVHMGERDDTRAFVDRNHDTCLREAAGGGRHGIPSLMRATYRSCLDRALREGR